MAYCETCLYWTKTTGAMGECHRFPQSHRTSYKSFCGEHPDFGKPDDEVNHDLVDAKEIIASAEKPAAILSEPELTIPGPFAHPDLPGKVYGTEGAMKRALTMKKKKDDTDG